MQQPKQKNGRTLPAPKFPVSHPIEAVPWSLLTNTQKAQLLLATSRTLDAEIFIHDFQSLEQPDVDDLLK